MEDKNVKKKKTKRHQFLLVSLVTVAILFVGQISGSVICGNIFAWVRSPGWALLVHHYLPFLFVHILLFGYLFAFERPILYSFLPAMKNGRKGNSVPLIFMGLFMGFALNFACALSAMAAGDIKLSFASFDPFFLLVALLLVCVQSAAEELLHRGYALSALSERYPLWVAIVLNALLFSLEHLVNPGITPFSLGMIFLAGASFGLMAVSTDSIWFPVMVHTAWNYTQNFLLGLPNSGILSSGALFQADSVQDGIFYDALFGLEGGLGAVIIWPLAAVVIYLFARNRKKKLGI